MNMQETSRNNEPRELPLHEQVTESERMRVVLQRRRAEWEAHAGTLDDFLKEEKDGEAVMRTAEKSDAVTYTDPEDVSEKKNEEEKDGEEKEEEKEEKNEDAITFDDLYTAPQRESPRGDHVDGLLEGLERDLQRREADGILDQTLAVDAEEDFFVRDDSDDAETLTHFLDTEGEAHENEDVVARVKDARHAADRAAGAM